MAKTTRSLFTSGVSYTRSVVGGNTDTLTVNFPAGNWTLPAAALADGAAADVRQLVISNVRQNRAEWKVTLSRSVRFASAYEGSPRLFHVEAQDDGAVSYSIPGPAHSSVTSDAPTAAATSYTWSRNDSVLERVRADAMVYAIGVAATGPGTGFAQGFSLGSRISVEDGLTPLWRDIEPVDPVKTFSGWDADSTGGSLSTPVDPPFFRLDYNSNASKNAYPSGFSAGHLRRVEVAVGEAAANLNLNGQRIIVNSDSTRDLPGAWERSVQALRVDFAQGLAVAKIPGPDYATNRDKDTTGNYRYNIVAQRRIQHAVQVWSAAVPASLSAANFRVGFDRGVRKYARLGVQVPPPSLTVEMRRLPGTKNVPLEFGVTVPAPALTVEMLVAQAVALEFGLTLNAPSVSVAMGIIEEGVPIEFGLTLNAPSVEMAFAVNVPAPIVIVPQLLVVPPPALTVAMGVLLRPPVPLALGVGVPAPALTVPMGVDTTAAPVVGADPILHALVEASVSESVTVRGWTGAGDLAFGGATWTDRFAVQSISGVGSQGRGGSPVRIEMAMPPGTERQAIRERTALIPMRAIVIASLNGGLSWDALRTRRGVMSAQRLEGDRLSFQLASTGPSVDRARPAVWSNASQQRASTGDLGLQYMSGLPTKKFFWPEVRSR